MRRLRFNVAYDGTDFNGWQVQPGLPTIQGTLEDAIGRIEGQAVHVAGSGRTDAGVHAFAQTAAVTLTNRIPPDNFRHAVNRLLPPTIRISSVTEADPDFHPRFHAKRKTYEYRLYRDEICPPFDRRFVYHYPYPLNETRMAEAARLLEGEHDFTAFAASDERDAAGESKARTIFLSNLCRKEQVLIYRVTGSGFLKHMVRNIVGVLIETGKGNLSHEDVAARLVPGNGIRPGPAAPASGLFLVLVEYE
ncbi:MAG: tRNA pseudouridine(38-40) synthase TruA [Acidobacteriaceae bacterium]|nr:tRNA pseudouridine(38-40) synthase TruA [Acidobacteriaceae bacterium]MBV9500555.1 tRNA pseudouridine(38-40) synthase TruA [Acidobacteriaceae bacterium]